MLEGIKQTQRHPEALGALRAERLEGWTQVLSQLPSFETAARKHARPPQDDVVIFCALFEP
jgi:hypothetical protein